MTISATALHRSNLRLPTTRAGWAALAGGALLAAIAGQALIAQVAGDRGIAPVASSTDITVGGIEVNATGKNPEDARRNGWLEAERKAWEKLGGPKISDSDLEDLVSAVAIEREQIGPRRYIAKLGVVFDRSRAGSKRTSCSSARSTSTQPCRSPTTKSRPAVFAGWWQREAVIPIS